MELRQNTQQTIIVGPFLDKTSNHVPITNITLSGLTYRHFIKDTWSVIDLNTGRPWIPTTGANGFYLTLLSATELEFAGNGTLYFYNTTIMSSPVILQCNVISQNMWDSKYSSKLLQVEQFAITG